MAPRLFRFGVQVSGAPTRSAWVELARRVEGAGYSTLTIPDHFTDQLAPVPALMAAADAAPTLRVGALVWDNDYRHPAVLAKELATLDVLTDGRLEVGLGAGWMRTDYDAAGMPYDSAGTRIERFAEGITIMKGLLAGETITFAGQHYDVRDLLGFPQAVQRPYPPFLIGGGGRRVLSLAAREADIIGINATLSAGVVGPDALASMTAEATDTKIGWVREAAGDRIDAIELNVRSFFVTITDDRVGTADALAGGLGLRGDDLLATPFALIGTAGQIADDLRARRERWGFSYIIVGGDDIDAFAPVVAELAGT